MVSCLQDGHLPGKDWLHMRDALHGPTTELTYEALTGKNKQSVPDCERVISLGVISFMEKKGYSSTAKVIKVMHNWHKAVDLRGLSETVFIVFQRYEGLAIKLLDIVVQLLARL